MGKKGRGRNMGHTAWGTGRAACVCLSRRAAAQDVNEFCCGWVGKTHSLAGVKGRAVAH